jgi:hypothetical protein
MKLEKKSVNLNKLKNLVYLVLIIIVKIFDYQQVLTYFKKILISKTLDEAWKLRPLRNVLTFKNNIRFNIYCIGDSHASFFSGYDRIQPSWPNKSTNKFSFLKNYRLGPVLAYNLCSFKTRSRGREKLFYILTHLIPLGSKVLFCFGEIDCRAHLLKQAEIQKREVHEIIRECVERYLSVIQETKKKGFDVIVWNVMPSGIIDDALEKDYPFYGTNVERNRVSKYFNEYLKQKLEKFNILFIDIFDKLVFENLETKDSYYFDGVHLSQKAMPYFLNKLLKKK